MNDSAVGVGKQCPTVFVEDTPADVDAFGPHKELADTLATMFTSGEEGGRTVGLAGSYGSGKSTVVSLLCQALPKHSNCYVWVFDAWAHEGDPLRRTFLESLTVSLEEQDWTERSWSRELEELRMKRRMTKTRTRPTLAIQGLRLALLLLAAPLGLVLLSDGLRSGVTVSWGAELNVMALIGGIIAMLPVAYALKVTLSSWWTNDRDWDAVANELSSIVVQKGEEDQQTISFETPDRTSLEFEHYFIELMREALSEEQRRLVLVIDNLDRVRPRDAAKIWATLRTFLDHSARARREDWFDRLWTVIPYDQDGIRLVQVADDEENGNATSSFLDKAIHVRFEVPTPLLQDWKRYFLELLREALPAHSAEDRDAIYGVIVATRLHRKRTPTPRLLKNVANWIGALHRRHGHALPLAHLTYYVALRMREPDWDAEEILRRTVDGSLPNGRERAAVPVGARESLAAIVHSVGRERAAFLLMGKPIKAALEEGNVQELPPLLERVVEPWTVVDDVLREARDEWVVGSPESFLRAAHALVESQVFNKAPEYEIARVRRELSQGVTAAQQLVPTGNAVKGLASVLTWAERSDAAELLYEALERGLQQAVVDDEKPRAAAALRQSRKVFLEAGYETVVARPILLPLEFRELASFLGEVDKPSGERADLMSVSSTVDVKRLQAEMKKALSSDDFGRNEAHAVLCLCQNVEEFDKEVAASQVTGRLTADQGPNAARAEHYMGVLLGLRPASDAHIRELGNGGHLAHLMHLLNGAGDRARARLIALYLIAVPDLTLPANTHNAQQGHNHLQELLRSPDEDLVEELERVLIDEAGPEHLVHAIQATQKNSPLLMGALGAIADTEAYDGLFTPEFTELVWLDLEDCCDREGLVARVATEEWTQILMASEFTISSLSFYNAVLAVRPEDESLTEWLVATLANADQATWQTWLKSHSAELGELAEQLVGRPGFTGLGETLRRALVGCAREVAQGSPKLPGISKLLKLLNAHNRATFQDRLADVLVSEGPQLPPTFFDQFGAEMARSTKLEEDSWLATEVVEPIVGSAHEESLGWLAEYFEGRTSSIGAGHYQKLLRDAVQARRTDSDLSPAQAESIERIARLLGLSGPEREDSSDTEPQK